MLIRIYTDSDTQSSDSFNFPIWLSKREFKRRGFTLCFECLAPYVAQGADISFINSHIFRAYWQCQEKKTEIFKFLEDLRRKSAKIFWFDTTDSTWCTQFEVLPFVDKFLKNQILKDKSLYTKAFKGGRIFTDFFSSLYGIEEENFVYYTPSLTDLNKIAVSWNSSIYNYSRFRNSFLSNVLRRVSNSLLYKYQSCFLKSFVPPEKKRTLDISARLNFKYNRPTVAKHRLKVAEILKTFGCDCSPVPQKKYFKELERSKIGVSPFGLGEICYRDYESIWFGTVLIKPDMSHIYTWPELYKDGITYIAHKWDLSDLSEKIEACLASEDFRIRIAKAAQNEYIYHFSEEGLENFSKRVLSFIEG